MPKSFTRNTVDTWHLEVPGTRWFRADLHLHTLDDFPGGHIARPPEVGDGDPTDPETQRLYARAFLQAAIGQGIEVLGITPHAVRAGPGDSPSTTWQIVDTWNEEDDDDGVPFREKIYAVFPGFEPSFTIGKRGGHLIFLFDPEVGREFFLQAFSVVMDGASPWKGNELQNSRRSAEDAFYALDGLFDREGVDPCALVLAPHAFTGKGILNVVGGQVAGDFPWARIAALELSDSMLPADLFKQKPWVKPYLEELRIGLFHGSDGYGLPASGLEAAPDQLGHRFTMVKMACPRIAALQQAFLANDSRVRLAFNERDDKGNVTISKSLPDAFGSAHPWLRSVKVTGGTSFFGGSDAAGQERTVEFRLNPSLTCIIGGRMSGESTFLDGLRIHLGFAAPVDERVRTDVEARAKTRFLTGDPEIALDFAGSAAGDGDWPAKFFTQRELQDAVEDQRGLRDILFHLIPTKSEELAKQQEELGRLDAELIALTGEIADARDEVADTAQAFQGAKDAKDALERFEAAGAERLTDVQADIGRVESYRGDIQVANESLDTAVSSLERVAFPDNGSELLHEFFPEARSRVLKKLVEEAEGKISEAGKALRQVLRGLGKSQIAGRKIEARLREEITQALVAAGGKREDLIAFDKFQRNASEQEVNRERLVRAQAVLQTKNTEFDAKEGRRRELILAHRQLIRDLGADVKERFDGSIRVRLEEEGIADQLDEWIRSLAQKGVTRWWNAKVEELMAPGESRLFQALEDNQLSQLGMSEDVASTFKDAMTEVVRCHLRALRSPDRYVLEWRVSEDPEEYREMSELSGGAQVSLLLSLLLYAEDNRPIVIDQPEEELDNQSLFGSVLPILRRLKGRRQIIFATHSANIVVNGDADQVICLEADHESGWVAVAGAIEDPPVRTAIVNTVDGGEAAFQLRQRKYGF